MEMGFNNSCWRQARVPGGLWLGGGHGSPAELWEECPLRNLLFLPAAPTSLRGAGARQEGSYSPSVPSLLRHGSCALDPAQTAPLLGGRGEKREMHGPMQPAAPRG